MNVSYSKKRLSNYVKMSVISIAFGIIILLISIAIEGLTYTVFIAVGIGEISSGIFMLIVYYFESKKQYLTLKNGELTKNTLFPKKIKLTEIKSIREFAGDLKFLTKRSEFVIDTQIIEPHSLAELKNELKKYNLE